ncbi:hypothetical protein [Paraburkholderia sp. BL9I2N2]|uniref:hypothetical protein n=1 Tax=Paraburkholderia sp. BL9I2N2 TaxID=1938809 RepID=UPI0010506148|nr:hypothetical protein [Paraburkholderia sp. BL9I2N2]TCK96991.1 hypothetical protein B0G74_3692 [Paraburkholderia sp. BL9I2N2]
MDAERKRVSLKPVREQGRLYYVAYSHDDELVIPLIDYSMYLSDRRALDEKSVDKIIRSVGSFFDFMYNVPNVESHWQFLTHVHDRLLEKYRDTEFKRVKENKLGSGDSLAAQKTVNGKLIEIYNFLLWYQHTNKLKELIGPFECRVSCRKIFGETSKDRFGGQNYFPLLYKRTGACTGGVASYIPSETDVSALSQYMEGFTEFVTFRNLLMLRLAKEMGWRRASLAALRCSQFSEERLAEMSDRGLVCVPPSQKFGYQNGFVVPPVLAMNVFNFIHDCRATFLAELGWDETRGDDHIFISASTGRPLRGNSLSAIVGKGMKSIGAPRRAGLHSFRGLFAEDKVGDETVARVALGLDTSTASVSAAVALEMGQRNPDSLRAYVNQKQSELVRRAVRRLNDDDTQLGTRDLTPVERARLLKK